MVKYGWQEWIQGLPRWLTAGRLRPQSADPRYTETSWHRILGQILSRGLHSSKSRSLKIVYLSTAVGLSVLRIDSSMPRSLKWTSSLKGRKVQNLDKCSRSQHSKCVLCSSVYLSGLHFHLLLIQISAAVTVCTQPRIISLLFVKHKLSKNISHKIRRYYPEFILYVNVGPTDQWRIRQAVWKVRFPLHLK